MCSREKSKGKLMLNFRNYGQIIQLYQEIIKLEKSSFLVQNKE